MFAHILVPHDLSSRNERALATALQLTERSGGRVTLLHVVQRIEHVPFGEVRTFYARLRKAAEKKMAAAARSFARRRIAVRTAVVIGAPAREIIRYAEANAVDLIVLASHRIDPASPAQGWGTTSYKVGVLCRCPVLLVK